MQKIKQTHKIIRHVLEKLYSDSLIEDNDTGERDKQFDFLVIHKDKTTIAVEGTSECDEHAMQLDHLLCKYTQSSILRPSLKCTWRIDLFKGTKNIKKLTSQLENYLSELEGLGIGDFNTEPDEYFSIKLENFKEESHEKYTLLIESLRAKFSFVRGEVLYQKAPSKIYIENGECPSSFVIPSSINEVIKKHTKARKDNVQKLAIANTDKKHLFILVHSTSFEAWVSLINNQELPIEFPQLPYPISTVWLAAFSPSHNSGVMQYVILSFSISSGWCIHPPVNIDVRLF